MSDFSSLIIKSDNFYSLGPVQSVQIEKAQKNLGLLFADDYKNYIEKYGAASFDCHELTGISSSDRLNVVTATNRAKNCYKNFPENYYVIEELLFDHIIIVQNVSGNIYSFSPVCGIVFLANSLKNYYFP